MSLGRGLPTGLRLGLLLGLALLAPAGVAASEPDAEPRYVTSRLSFAGTVLGRKVIDLGDDGTLDLVVAVSVRRPGGGRRRELRVHPFEGDATVAAEAASTIPIMDDVVAYGFGDVRTEAGPELLFLTSSGAYSYSPLKDGYRDNIARLAETDLLFDVADPEALPEWRYVLPGRGGADGVLLPERGGFSLWSGPSDSTYGLVSRIGRDEGETTFVVENSVRVRGGRRNFNINFDDHNLFLTEYQGALSSLLSSRNDVQAPALVDVNGDGRTDLLQRHKDELWVHIDEGQGIPAEPTRIEPKPEYLKRDNTDLDRLLYDIDRDGDIDMLAQLDDEREGLDAGVTRLLVLVNDGTRLYPEQPDQVLRFEGAAVQAEVEDVDGDGRADLVITKYEAPSLAELATNFRLTRSVFLYLGRGDRPFEKKPALRNEQTFGIETLEEAVVDRHLKIDFSGDGIADLVEVDPSGRVAIRRVTRSSGFFGGESWELDGTPWKRFDLQGSLENLTVEDVNGDGLGDLLTHNGDTLALAFSPEGAVNRTVPAALAVLLAITAPASSQDAAPPPWVESRLDVAYGERLALRDMNGDGRLDVVRVGPGGVAVFSLDDEGRISAGPTHELAWPSARVGWDLLDFDGDGATEVVLYLDGERVSVWRPAMGTDTEDVLTDQAGLLPVGIRRIQFARDVDDDGRVDLIIPATGRFLIHVRTDDGFTGSPLEIGYQANIRQRMGDPSRLDAEFEQRVSIPLFRLDDIDGDGRPDLVSETDDDLAVYLARPGLPPEPDWTLDLGALRSELDQPQGIDFEDLTRMIPPDIGWVTADLDGEAPLDLVLQRGSRITTHLSGSHGPDLDRPDQVLKASGNVLHFLVRDIDGDGLDDLQLLRVESVSLGTVLRWLVISGALDFDVFTYRNEGGSLARKPTTRKSLALGHPGILDFADEAEEFGEELGRRFEWQARAADLTGSGRADDVVDADEARVRFHRDGVPADWVSFEDRIRDKDVQQLLEELFIYALDDMPDGSRKLFEIDKLDDFIPMPGWSLHLAVQEREPFAVWTVPEGWRVDEVRVRDIDGDGRDDSIIVLEHTLTDANTVVFLVTR